jgi:uncharacterized protein (DUF4415 family)
MNEKDTVVYTSENMPTDSKTDWARLRAMTDEEIEQNALSDPDALPMSKEEWENAVLIVPGEEGKERIALWIDRDILRHFGKGSKGYQSRLNAALRRVMVTEMLYGKDLTA